MKRSLSLVLALVMILGSFSTVFAAEATAVEKAGAFLNEKGILSGYAGSGDLGLEDNLLRQDTLVLVARLLGEFDEAKAHKGEVTYEDVKDKTYVPLAAWAKENNTFVGHSDAKFGFGENLKAQEYAKVLLTALGYKVAPNGDSDIKWADALAKAKEFGILADVKVEDATEITRGEMAVMTVNALGVTMKGSKETLADKLGITMPAAEELKVEEVRTENLAEIVVELSNAKLVKNKEALTNPANYRIDDSDIKVYNVDVEGNDLVLTLVPYGKVEENTEYDTLVKGKEYKLTIRNVEGISQTNKFTAKDNVIPRVEKVEVLGTHGIKVTTNEPINNPQERNFRVGSKRTSMIIEQYGRELVLTPYHNVSFDKDATELSVEELRDFANYKSATSIEKLGEVEDDATPEVVKAYRNGKKLTLVFDRDIYRKSVKSYENRRDQGNVSFVERRVTFYAEIDSAKKIDTNVAEYTFEREIPRDAVITVQGVKNHSEKEMVKQEIETTLFDDEHAPVVISKLSVNVESTGNQERGKVTNSTKGLKVEFDKDIKELEDALTYDVKAAKKDVEDEVAGAKTVLKGLLAKELKATDFFKVYELEVSNRGSNNAASVKVVIENIETDSITISFEGAVVNNRTRDFDYVLEVSNFTDGSRNRMVREYIDFQVVPTGIAFDVDGNISLNQKTRDNVEVVIKFTKAVNKASAENVKNYFFGEEGKKLIVDEAIVERDGKTVSLVIRDTTVAKVEEYVMLEISPAVVDLDDNSIVGSRYFNLETGKKIILDQADLNTVIGLIEALKAVESITLADKAEVEAAKTAYDKLSRDAKNVMAKELVDKLDAAVAKIKKLEDGAKEDEVKEEEKAKAIDAAEVAIFRLPAVADFDVTNADQVAKVKAARVLVDAALKLDEDAVIKGIEDLKALELEIEAVEKLAEAIKKAEAAIKNLPAVEDFDAKNEEQVAAVKAAKELVAKVLELDGEAEIKGLVKLEALEKLVPAE